MSPACRFPGSSLPSTRTLSIPAEGLRPFQKHRDPPGPWHGQCRSILLSWRSCLEPVPRQRTGEEWCAMLRILVHLLSGHLLQSSTSVRHLRPSEQHQAFLALQERKRARRRAGHALQRQQYVVGLQVHRDIPGRFPNSMAGLLPRLYLECLPHLP